MMYCLSQVLLLHWSAVWCGDLRWLVTVPMLSNFLDKTQFSQRGEVIKRVAVFLAVMTGLVVLSAVAASAAGFALIEQSVKGLGNSFAGGAAIAEDATTIYFNPAGMARLEGMNATAGLHVILPSAKFSTTSATNPVGGDISTAPSGGDGGEAAVVPNFYFAAQASESSVTASVLIPRSAWRLNTIPIGSVVITPLNRS